MRNPLERTESQVPADGDGRVATKHTPGPWQFYADLPSTEPNWHIVTNASRMRVVANVHIEPGNSVDEANARLIAAAPNLYSALRLALAALEGKPCGQQAIDDGHAAIAAAGGPAVKSAAVHAISEPAMPHVAAPTTEWFVYYRQQIALQARQLTRLQKIETAALRVASSRRNRVVTDQGPLDALEAALKARS